MKKNNVIKIVLAVVAVIVIVLCSLFVSGKFDSRTARDGSIEIKLVNLDGSVESDNTFQYASGATLVNILENNYSNVVITDNMLMSIEDFTTPDDWSSYIAIYVDGEMSQVGVNEINLFDYSVITFQMTEYTAE